MNCLNLLCLFTRICSQKITLRPSSLLESLEGPEAAGARRTMPLAGVAAGAPGRRRQEPGRSRLLQESNVSGADSAHHAAHQPGVVSSQHGFHQHHHLEGKMIADPFLTLKPQRSTKKAEKGRSIGAGVSGYPDRSIRIVNWNAGNGVVHRNHAARTAGQASKLVSRNTQVPKQAFACSCLLCLAGLQKVCPATVA